MQDDRLLRTGLGRRGGGGGCGGGGGGGVIHHVLGLVEDGTDLIGAARHRFQRRLERQRQRNGARQAFAASGRCVGFDDVDAGDEAEGAARHRHGRRADAQVADARVQYLLGAQLALVLEQLAQKVEVGRNRGPFRLDVTAHQQQQQQFQ